MNFGVPAELPQDGVASLAVTAGRAPEAPLLAGARAPKIPTARRYLMCPPRHFAVDYAINPWMNPAEPVSVERAMAQWTELRDTYRRLGHNVAEIEPRPGLPDMVFAANSATVIGGRVLGARFRAPQRALEAEHFRRWFVEHGYREIVMPVEINEAEGDFAWTGRWLLAGTGFTASADPVHDFGDTMRSQRELVAASSARTPKSPRAWSLRRPTRPVAAVPGPESPFRTGPAAHAEAQEVLGVPVVSLRLTDPRYYHLDTALFVLSEATEDTPAQIAYYPEAFSPGSRRVLTRLFPDAVLADAADAECLGLNGVSDGLNVVLPREATALADRLTARGYAPVLVDISELRKSGGGPKCCTLEIRD